MLSVERLSAEELSSKDEMFFNADRFDGFINEFLSDDSIIKQTHNIKNNDYLSVKPRDGLGMDQNLVVFDWYFPFENIFMHPLDYQWLETAGVTAPQKIDFVAIEKNDHNEGFIVFYTGVPLDFARIKVKSDETSKILVELDLIKPGYYAIPFSSDDICASSVIEGFFISSKNKKKVKRTASIENKKLVKEGLKSSYSKTTMLGSMAETSNDLVFNGGAYSSGFK